MSLHQLHSGIPRLLRPGPTTIMLQFSYIIIVYGSYFRVKYKYITVYNKKWSHINDCKFSSAFNCHSNHCLPYSFQSASSLHINDRTELFEVFQDKFFHHKYVISHCTISTTAVDIAMLYEWNTSTMMGTS